MQQQAAPVGARRGERLQPVRQGVQRHVALDERRRLRRRAVLHSQPILFGVGIVAAGGGGRRR